MKARLICEAIARPVAEPRDRRNLRIRRSISSNVSPAASRDSGALGTNGPSEALGLGPSKLSTRLNSPLIKALLRADAGGSDGSAAGGCATASAKGAEVSDAAGSAVNGSALKSALAIEPSVTTPEPEVFVRGCAAPVAGPAARRRPIFVCSSARNSAGDNFPGAVDIDSSSGDRVGVSGRQSCRSAGSTTQ